VGRGELIRRGHTLEARVVMGRLGMTDAFVAQVDEAMTKRDLLKVRIEAESGREASRLAVELAQRVEAQVVQRVGRVALLYRPLQGGRRP
jgi:RNA-binding protein